MSEKTIDVVPGKTVIKRVPKGNAFESKVVAEYNAVLEDSELKIIFKGSRKIWRAFEKKMNVKSPQHFFRIQLIPSEVKDLEELNTKKPT